jgi:hypothetical protein
MSTATANCVTVGGLPHDLHADNDDVARPAHDPDAESVCDFTEPQVALQAVHAMHIVVSRGKSARAISTQDRNVRLAIWLGGWRIEIYEEFDGQHQRVGLRKPTRRQTIARSGQIHCYDTNHDDKPPADGTRADALQAPN